MTRSSFPLVRVFRGGPRSTAATVAAAAMIAAACAPTSRASREPAPEPAAATPVRVLACPLELPGTTLEIADTPSGVALEFATSLPYVAALRERVAILARAHDARHDPAAAPAGTGVRDGGVHRRGVAAPPLPPSRARARPVARGAALELVPDDVDDLAQLRRKIRRRWRSGQAGCPNDQLGDAS